MASDQHQLLEILSDVFAGRADYHEPDIVAAFFAERADLLRELHEPKHQVILGRRGTGKTMVLKYLSLPAQIHCLGTTGSVVSSAFDFVGFYVPLAEELQPKVGPEDDKDLAPLFGHWFNLVTAVPILDAIDLLQTNSFVSDAAAEKFVLEFSTNILGKRFRDLKRSRDWINTQIRDILSQSHLATSRSIQQQLAYEKTLPRLTSPRTFHAEISSLLNASLKQIFRVRPRFFFLLDRFDEVSAERQNVIKEMIQSHQGQLYYVKLGVAHRDKLHLAGLTVQDYRVLNIEHRVNSETYFKFCEKVLQKRLEVIRQKVNEKGIDQRLAAIFNDPATLLPSRSFEEQAKKEGLEEDRQKTFWQPAASPDFQAFRLLIHNNVRPTYAGIANLAAISSGCIRIFIEGTHRVISHALLTSVNLVLQENSIPLDIQHEAIKDESDQRFSQELRASISALTDERSVQEASVNLLVFLLKEFSRSLSRADYGVHCFELQDSLSPANDKALVEAFLVLERLGLITPADGGAVTLEAGARYVVARMFAPHYLLPPQEEGCIIVSADSLRHAVDPNHPWKGGGKEATLDLQILLECFYATGFRHDWENSLRGYLEADVFPKYQLSYSDGEDYHNESHQIGRSVGGLLQRAKFFIAEITDHNENVCYEMGLGIALGKWFCRIKNTMQKVSTPHSVIDELLRSLKYDTYQYDPSVKTEDGRINMLRSVDQVIGQIASRFRKLKPKDRERVNPFEKKHPLHLIQSSPRTELFLWADQSERMFSWLSDFNRNVMEDLKLLVYVDPGPSYEGPMALKYLKAIARSTHCVIDITNKNRFGAFLLGYAVGRKRAHLAVWRRGTDSMITSYRGEAGQVDYANKGELWTHIRTFLQSSQDIS